MEPLGLAVRTTGGMMCLPYVGLEVDPSALSFVSFSVPVHVHGYPRLGSLGLIWLNQEIFHGQQGTRTREFGYLQGCTCIDAKKATYQSGVKKILKIKIKKNKLRAH